MVNNCPRSRCSALCVFVMFSDARVVRLDHHLDRVRAVARLPPVGSVSARHLRLRRRAPCTLFRSSRFPLSVFPGRGHPDPGGLKYLRRSAVPTVSLSRFFRTFLGAVLPVSHAAGGRRAQLLLSGILLGAGCPSPAQPPVSSLLPFFGRTISRSGPPLSFRSAAPWAVCRGFPRSAALRRFAGYPTCSLVRLGGFLAAVHRLGEVSDRRATPAGCWRWPPWVIVFQRRSREMATELPKAFIFS